MRFLSENFEFYGTLVVSLMLAALLINLYMYKVMAKMHKLKLNKIGN